MSKAVADVDWTKVKNLMTLDDVAEELLSRYEWFTLDMRNDVKTFVETHIATELDITIPSFS